MVVIAASDDNKCPRVVPWLTVNVPSPLSFALMPALIYSACLLIRPVISVATAVTPPLAFEKTVEVIEVLAVTAALRAAFSYVDAELALAATV